MRTSSSGVGRTIRRSEVRHSSVISSRSRRRTSRSSDGVRRGSSSRASRTAQRPSATSVGPPARLGRVRGQDRADRQPADERVELRVGPAEPAQAGDRIGDRIVEHAIPRRPLAPAQRPHPAARLGQVDQPEIEREGADDGLRGAEVERPQLLVEPGPLERVVVAAEGDRPPPDPLDEREQLRPGLLRDDLAEQGAEQPDLHRQRVAGARRPDPERLRGDRGRTPRNGSGGPRGSPVPRPSRHPTRNLPDRNLSVGLYRDDRDDRPIRVLARPRDRPRHVPRRARRAPPTSSSSCASCTRSPAWRRPREPGMSCSRPSSTGPATCSTPMSPRCTCSTAMERT